MCRQFLKVRDDKFIYDFYCKLFFDVTNESLWVQKFITIIPQVGTYVLIATVFRKKFGDTATFLSLIFFKEKISLQKWIGIIIAAVSMVLLAI